MQKENYSGNFEYPDRMSNVSKEAEDKISREFRKLSALERDDLLCEGMRIIYQPRN